MAKIKIFVRYTGAGWQVTNSIGTADNPPRPYSTRDEAVSDAFFASRMLKAMGDDVAVFIESGHGIVEATTEPEQLWRRH